MNVYSSLFAGGLWPRLTGSLREGSALRLSIVNKFNSRVQNLTEAISPSSGGILQCYFNHF